MTTPRHKPLIGWTRLPILLGVVVGIVVAGLFLRPFQDFYYGMFPTRYAGRLADPSVHLTLYELTSAALGGSVGALLSRWRKKKAFLFLLAVLVAVALFKFYVDFPYYS